MDSTRARNPAGGRAPSKGVCMLKIVCFAILGFLALYSAVGLLAWAKLGAAGNKPSPASSQTHYGVLGVATNATAEEIRSAYRKQVRLNHPDKIRRHHNNNNNNNNNNNDDLDDDVKNGDTTVAATTTTAEAEAEVAAANLERIKASRDVLLNEVYRCLYDYLVLRAIPREKYKACEAEWLEQRRRIREEQRQDRERLIEEKRRQERERRKKASMSTSTSTSGSEFNLVVVADRVEALRDWVAERLERVATALGEARAEEVVAAFVVRHKWGFAAASASVVVIGALKLLAFLGAL